MDRVPIQRLAPQPVKPRVSAGFLGGDHHLPAPQSTGTLPRVPDDNLGGATPPTAAHLPGARGSAPRWCISIENRRSNIIRLRHRAISIYGAYFRDSKWSTSLAAPLRVDYNLYQNDSFGGGLICVEMLGGIECCIITTFPVTFPNKMHRIAQSSKQ